MERVIVIAIYICGLAAMVVEMFVPGMVMGIMGFLAVLGSIGYAVAQGDYATATVLILLSVALVPVFFVMWKAVIAKHFALRGDEKGFKSTSRDTEELLGAEGVALTPLRPSGLARLEGMRVDVVTRGEMLDKGTQVKVIDIRPGFVDTPMTAEFDKGALWVPPEKVGGDIARAIEKGGSVVYSPWFWRYIMLIIRNVPAFVFHKTNL